jgi:hypothetical protein
MTFHKRPSFATGWLNLRSDLVPSLNGLLLNGLLIDSGRNSCDASVNAERGV